MAKGVCKTVGRWHRDNPKGTLTPNQKAFVKAYLETGNGKQSWMSVYPHEGRVPYLAEQAAYKLLKMPKIAAAVDAGRAEAAKTLGVSAERITAELVKIAFTKITDIVEWGESVPVANEETGEIKFVQGIKLKASAEIPEINAAAIAKIRQAKDGTISIEMHDKIGALEKLGRSLGMFPTQVKGEIEHKHTAGTEPISASYQWLENLLGRSPDGPVEIPVQDGSLLPAPVRVPEDRS